MPRNRGPIDEATLAVLLEQGLSLRSIGRRLGVSLTTVRYWVGRYGLGPSGPAKRIEKIRHARALGAKDVILQCPRHGPTRFMLLGGSGVRCRRCSSAAVADRRRRVKETLVEEAGGRCCLCGYDRCVAALQFHHVDPGEKQFGLAQRGHTFGIKRAREEAAKCVLLCANCHAEVEAGLIQVPRIEEEAA